LIKDEAKGENLPYISDVSSFRLKNWTGSVLSDKSQGIFVIFFDAGFWLDEPETTVFKIGAKNLQRMLPNKKLHAHYQITCLTRLPGWAACRS
jgi:hypothetical protein